MQSLVRVLLAGNPLAVCVVARALLENHAAGFYVASKLEDARVSITNKGIGWSQRLTGLEEDLLRLLGAGAGETAPSAISRRAADLHLIESTAIRDYLTTTFRDKCDADAVGTWELLSDVLHGNAGPSGLDHTASAEIVKVGTAVLAELGSTSRQLDVIAEFHRSVPGLVAFRELVDQGGTLAEAGKLQSEIYWWIPGKHFTGTGARDNPYRFTRGLSFDNVYDSFLKYLRTHDNVTVASRKTDFIDGIGVVEHVRTSDDRDIYIDPQYHLADNDR